MPLFWSLKRRRLGFHNFNLRLACFKTQLRKCKKGMGLCCTHNPYYMILVANLTSMMVNLLCVLTSALFVLNGFLARMLLLLVVGTCTTHLALHIMLVLMHVARLMIVRKHGRVKTHYRGAKNVVTLYYFPRVSMFELQSW
jgi:hypothetical protein